jgi:hypothetical protein
MFGRAFAALIARTMLLTRRRKTASVFRSRDSAAALPAEAVRPAGQTEQTAWPQIVGVAVNEGEPALQPFAVRQEPLASPCAYPTNLVFTACVIFVLDKIQCLDYAPESSLEPDSYSRTTIRHSNKPRPWCRRTRERYHRNRRNRSCSCQILFRWPAESGHAS